MKLGYINPATTTTELLHQIEQQKTFGVNAENITINKTFPDFIDNIPPECTTIVVTSYCSAISSLTQLLQTVITMHKRGISLESATEPTICPPNGNIESIELIQHIAIELNRINTAKYKNTSTPKRGRPLGSSKHSNKAKEVDTVRQQMSISIEKACRLVGCQPRTYYRHKAKMQN